MKNKVQKGLERTGALFLGNLILLFFYQLISLQSFAQYTVRFDVIDSFKKGEIFLTGSFNNWNPGESSYKLIPIDATHKYIILENMPSGTHSFKFTRGKWETVESASNGMNISNRVINVKENVTAQLHIAGWADDFKVNSNLPASASFTVRFDVYDPTQKAETFLAGSFNHFNPGDSRYKLAILDATHKSITLTRVRPGKYFFKFTRGNWGTVESTATGGNIEDRVIEITKDTVVQLRIAGWVDDYINFTKLPDSTRLEVGWQRSFFYRERNLDSSYKYALYSFELSKKNNDKKSETRSLIVLGEVFKRQGNSARALELFLQALPMAAMRNDSFHLVMINQNIGNIFESETEYDKAKHYYRDAIRYTSSATDIRDLWRSELFLSLGEIYFNDLNVRFSGLLCRAE